ncbi:hypothetical protein ACFX1Z_037775 [Malus domestica]
MPKKQEGKATPSSSKNDDEPAKPATTKGNRMPSNEPSTPIFRYILIKADAQRHKDNLSDAKAAGLPQSFIKALPKEMEPSFLPTKRTEEGFDPNVYKLMSKAGYDFASSSSPGKKFSNTVNDKECNLTKTQKKLKHGYGVDNNKAGLGFTLNAPVKISSKAKNASTQHISVSIEHDQEEPKSTPRTSVFDRMKCSRPRISTLNRTGALERLEDNKKLSRNRETTSKEEKLDGLAEKGDIRSSIPSRMKRQAILEFNTNGPLKVRRRTIIHTGQSSCQQAQEDGTKGEV